MRHFALLLCLVAAKGLVGPGEARAQTFCPNTNTNIRMLTVSAHCSSFSGENIDELYDMDLKTRMSRIADIIDKQDPDVVAIQDAFHESCRDALASHLSAKYPSFVQTLAHEPFAHDDSGMMLFSKHSFEAFTSPHKKNSAVKLTGKRGALSFNETSNFVAWYLFEGIDNELMGSDRDTSKMAAMVRLHPKGGCPVNVAFTHLQSKAGKGEVDEALSMEKRQRDLAGLRRMITGTLSDSQLRTEPVFVLGNFEIDGNLSPSNVSTTAYKYKFTTGNESVAVVTGYGEWDEAFEPTHASDPEDPFEDVFFRCGRDGYGATAASNCLYDFANNPRLLTDTWGFEMPGSDWGQTRGIVGQKSAADVAALTDEGGQRLSYILHNQPGDGRSFLCPQRIARVFFWDPDGPPQFFAPPTYDSFESGTVPFADDKVVSDQFFVVGDFLFQRAARCNAVVAPPWNADGPTFGATKVTWGTSPDTSFGLSLGSAATGNRRHYAWFQVDKKGTVSIGTSQPSRTEVFVYHHSDLSTPISSYHGMSNTWDHGRGSGPVYDFPDPPYYVRFAIDPTVATPLPVSFVASFHEHRCSSPDNDYCVLTSNAEYSVLWPGGQWIMPYQAPAPPAYPDAMYFVAAVDQASSGANPFVDFTIELASQAQVPIANPPAARVFGKCSYDLSLPDCGGAPCNSSAVVPTFTPWAADSDGDGLGEITLHTGNDVNGLLAPASPGVPVPVLLRVRRSCAPAQCLQQEMHVTYKTSLLTLTPLSLAVVDENDFGSNDDEIFMHVAADEPGPGPASCVALSGYSYLGRFDEHGESNKSEAAFPGVWGISPRTFIDSTTATVCESDGGDGSDNDFLGEAVFSAAQTPVPPGQTQATFSTPLLSEDTQYTYTFRVKTEQLSTPVQTCP